MCCICKCCVNIIGCIIKACLYIFNVFFWVAGCSLLGWGIYAATESVEGVYQPIMGDMGTEMYDAAVGLTITLGILIFIAGVVGICGLCKDSRCLLISYIIFMGCVLAVQISIVTLSALFNEDAKVHLDETMYAQIQEDYYLDQDITDAWDNLQADKMCCGKNSHRDYDNSYFAKNNTYTWAGGSYPIPESCCVKTETGHQNIDRCMLEAEIGDPIVKFIYDKGCYDAAVDVLDERATALYATMFVVAIFVILSMVLGFCKCCGAEGDDNKG